MATTAEPYRHFDGGVGSSSNNSLPIVLSLIAVIVGVIAVVIGVVSISQKGNYNYNISGRVSGDIQTRGDDDYVWTIAVGLAQSRFAYSDPKTGMAKGFQIDLVNAVCRIANKNCRLVADVHSRCWDSEVGETQRGGVGILDKYYDACAAWWPNKLRMRTFKFSKAFTKKYYSFFCVKPGNPGNFNWRDVTGKKIGFIDGWASDEACLRGVSDKITGADIPAENIVHYTGRDALIAGILSGEVDAGFDGSKAEYKNIDAVQMLDMDDISCVEDGGSMMMRKDNLLAEWFNPALERLLATSEYRTICNDLIEQHGDYKGPNPEDFCIL